MIGNKFTGQASAIKLMSDTEFKLQTALSEERALSEFRRRDAIMAKVIALIGWVLFIGHVASVPKL